MEINVRLTKIPRSVRNKFNVGDEVFAEMVGHLGEEDSFFKLINLTGDEVILDAEEIYGKGITFVEIF